MSTTPYHENFPFNRGIDVNMILTMTVHGIIELLYLFLILDFSVKYCSKVWCQ